MPKEMSALVDNVFKGASTSSAHTSADGVGGPQLPKDAFDVEDLLTLVGNAAQGVKGVLESPRGMPLVTLSPSAVGGASLISPHSPLAIFESDLAPGGTLASPHSFLSPREVEQLGVSAATRVGVTQLLASANSQCASDTSETHSAASGAPPSARPAALGSPLESTADAFAIALGDGADRGAGVGMRRGAPPSLLIGAPAAAPLLAAAAAAVAAEGAAPPDAAPSAPPPPSAPPSAPASGSPALASAGPATGKLLADVAALLSPAQLHLLDTPAVEALMALGSGRLNSPRPIAAN